MKRGAHAVGLGSPIYREPESFLRRTVPGSGIVGSGELKSAPFLLPSDHPNALGRNGNCWVEYVPHPKYEVRS